MTILLKRPFLVLAPMLLLLFVGCKKSERVESKGVPDLAKQTQPYLTNRGTMVRSGPGPRFKTIGKIPGDTRVDVVGKDGDWLLVISKHGNPPGYIEAGDASPTTVEAQQSAPQVEGPYVVLDNTQVRKGPGTKYGVAAKIPKGTKINVVGAENGWLKVESKHGNPPGYIDQAHAQRSEQ